MTVINSSLSRQHSFLVPGDFSGVMSQVLDISIPRQPCQVRFVPVPRDIIKTDKTDTWEIELNSVLDQFTDPLPLTWGSHSFGLIDVAERREIRTSLLDMMGYRPVSPRVHYSALPYLPTDGSLKVYNSFLLPSIGPSLPNVVDGGSSY